MFISMTSFAFPEPPQPIAPTAIDEVDRRLGQLHAKRDAWTQVTVAQRIQLLQQCMETTVAAASGWAEDACKLKGIQPHAPLAGEEWLGGPVTTLRHLRLLVESLEYRGQRPPPKMETRADGRTVATVFPTDIKDKIMFTGFRAEVWVGPEDTASQGAIYTQPPGPGQVCLVLGAGNVSSIAPMDALHKLFVENEVVLLKMNPVNAVLGPHIERALAPIIQAGFLSVVYGGMEVGQHLTDHPQIDTLHITGSDQTYDAIVWGADPAERKQRKASGERLNQRPFTAELGCVTPILVVPGPWSESDMDFQAMHVAAMVQQNASFNCNAGKVLTIAGEWDLADTFIARVRDALSQTPGRKAYYPGAMDRYNAFLEHYPNAIALGARTDEMVPWTTLPDVPATAGEYALRTEAFCGVLAEVKLPGKDPGEFLTNMVNFANDVCWGTLSCQVLIHPKTQKQYAAQFEQAVTDLRYGGVSINAWAAVLYGLVSTSWGAYPGHPPEDIQSGAGVVHNTFMFDHPEKSVLYAPFRIQPKPLWFPNHKNLLRATQKLLAMESRPSYRRLLPLVASALKG